MSVIILCNYKTHLLNSNWKQVYGHIRKKCNNNRGRRAEKKGMIEILLLLIERVHDDAIPFSYMYHWKSEIPKDNASKDIEF